MEKIPPVLQTCPIFDGIRPEDLAGMMTCLGARQIHPRKGDTLFREGDTTRFVGVVLSGAVYLLREDYYGSRSILAHIGPTQIFGEAYAFSGAEALPVSVVAEEDSHILLLDSQRLTTCCTNVPTQVISAELSNTSLEVLYRSYVSKVDSSLIQRVCEVSITS